jgi:biotin carboxyl carrier protein
VQKTILKGYEKGEKPITCRAADLLEPEMENAKEATKDIAKDIGDVLVYALYPQTGMRYLRWKYGLEPVPDSVKPKTLEEVERENELIKKAKEGQLVEKVEKVIPAKGPGVRTFNVYVEDEYYKVEVEPTGAASVTGPVVSASPQAAPAVPRPEAAPVPVKAVDTTPAAAPVAEGDIAVMVPMPGTVIRYEVKEGDRVKSGDIVVMLEAMKMENAIPSPADGVIKSVHYGPGASVKKGDVLAVIAK